MGSGDTADRGDVVVLGPDCTIRSIGLAHDALRAHRPPGGTLRVDCSGVDAADITFVQLIVSARRTLASRQVGLALDPVSDCVRSAFDRSGVPIHIA